MLRGKFRITYNAPVVLTFVLFCMLATMAGVLTSGYTTQLLFITYHSPLTNLMTYVRMFTHVLGHLDWGHFMGNALYLLLLGPMLEEKYRGRRLLFIILITAAVTSIVNYLFFPMGAICGASGVVFAFILMASFTGFREGEIPLTFILIAVIYIGQQIYEGIALTDNISNMAHIVGGLVGSIAGYVLNRRPGGPAHHPFGSAHDFDEHHHARPRFPWSKR